jgi:ATP-dependent helicase/nuclease subunit A
MIPDSALFFLAKEVGETYMEKLDSGFKVNGYDDKELALLRNAAQLILKWLALRERVSLADLLKTIINDIHLKTVLSAELNGEQFVANIDKLINLADSFDSGGLGGLQDFLANINELINRETKEGDAAVDIDDEETVKIMTIHASKGLQFPVVFLPNLNPQNRGMKDSVFIDPALGLASVLTDIETDKNREHTLLNLLKALLIEKDLAEKKRIFYVAATRASNYLFMTAEYKKDKINDNTPLSWLENVFDINNPAKSFSENFGFEITRGYSTDFIDESSYIKKDFIDHLQRAVDKYKSKHDNIPSHLHSLKISQPAQTFSATKIMVFIKDKDEYYRRYHLGFFEDDYNTFAKDVYKSDHHLLRGSIIHKYLELKDSFNDENKLIDKIISDFDVFDLHLANNLKDDIKRLYKKMTDSSIGKRILNAKKYRNEAVINAHIGNDYLTGALDRIILNEDDLWEIVDYKTNKISLENLDREAKKYEWQIKTYAIFISRLYPEQEQYPISFYFLEIDHLYQVTFSHDEIIAMEVDIIKIMAEIKKTFPVR